MIGARQARVLKLDEDQARTLVNGIVAELVSQRETSDSGVSIDQAGEAITDGTAADGRD